MEKLLHERLREHEDGNNFVLSDGFRAVITQKAACRLADEIERYYIPRPRFEDGEPVQFGDSTEALPSGVACFEFARYKTGLHDANGKSKYHENGALIKRPTPKVYDADGVAYERGETVFNIETGEEKTVEDLDECAVKVKGDETWWSNDCFTHEKPVFDAEGVRICKDDTVYWTDGTSIPGKKYIVDRITFDETSSYSVQVYDINGGWMPPHQLTHREPDSLEKLRDDMKRNNIDPVPMEINAWIDRLTALIERDAK